MSTHKEKCFQIETVEDNSDNNKDEKSASEEIKENSQVLQNGMFNFNENWILTIEKIIDGCYDNPERKKWSSVYSS